MSGLGEDAVVEAGQALGEAGAGGAVPQPSPAPLARDAEVQRPAQLQQPDYYVWSKTFTVHTKYWVFISGLNIFNGRPKIISSEFPVRR